jgi:di/tricarboxylate transporter
MSPATQDLLVWSVLAVVLFAVARGHPRFELFAVAGVLMIGLTGLVPQSAMLAGFGHPALATIVSLYVVGQAITDTGLLTGLGTALEYRLKSHHRQVLGLSMVAAGLSAFMSNVGALSALLPTASRMAERAEIPPGRYGLPISMAAILGGTMTLVGSAPTVIVSGYRTLTSGQPFRMFDFLPHGAAILASGVVVWMIWGRRLLRGRTGLALQQTASAVASADGTAGSRAQHDQYGPVFAPFATKRRRRCLLIFVTTIVATTSGFAPPAIGFGLAAVLMVLAGVIDGGKAYAAIDLHIVLFLGSMLSMGRIMEATGTLARLTALIGPVAASLPRLGLLGLLFVLSCILGNVLNNAASAAVMAPLALQLSAVGVSASSDAMLMAVAAGACLAIILPTHQATLLGMSKTGFSPQQLRAAGWRVVLFASLAAVLVIERTWP